MPIESPGHAQLQKAHSPAQWLGCVRQQQLFGVRSVGYWVQLAFTPASPSAKAPKFEDLALAKTHSADVPESFGPAIPLWFV